MLMKPVPPKPALEHTNGAHTQSLRLDIMPAATDILGAVEPLSARRKTPRELKQERLNKRKAAAASPRKVLEKVANAQTNAQGGEAAACAGMVGDALPRSSSASMDGELVGLYGLSDASDSRSAPTKRRKATSPKEDLLLFQEADSMCGGMRVCVPPTSDSGLAKAAVPEDSEEECGADGSLLQSNQSIPPYDGSIKIRCRITSTRSFDWVKQIGGAVEASAVQQFGGAKGPVDPSAGAAEALSNSLAGTGFVESLLHWKFPAAALPPSLVRTYQQLTPSNTRVSSPTGSPADDRQWLQQRRREWQTSFRSLYYAFMQGNCSDFYMVGKSTKDSLFPGFVAIFSRRGKLRGEVGGGELTALLSRTTRGLRKGLEDEAVEFDMPSSSAASDGGGAGSRSGSSHGQKSDGSGGGSIMDAAEAEEARQFAAEADKTTIYRTQMSDVRDGTSSSLVRVRGKDNVAGLYDYLFNGVGGALDDVPALYAACPFSNSTIGRAKHKVSPVPVEPAAAAGGSDGSESAARYTLTITGVLLPDSLSRLYREMERRQGSNFSAQLQTEALTRGVNTALQPNDSECPPLWNRAHVSVKVDCTAGRYVVGTSARGA